jgi:YidC/Oxa1 family membrane protein insertase
MANLWNVIILRPALNGLIALSGLLPHAVEFGLAIIIFTVIVRLAMTPVVIRQTKSTRAMQELQPKMKELQKKYAKNKQKLQQETMKLYKEAGVNPVGCMWPMLIQFPVWIALYQSIMKALAATPENLLDLAQHLYGSELIARAVPVNSNFLWLDLGQPDSTMILAILVGGSMWVQQKMTTAPAADPRQAQTNQMMLMMMPMMFGLFTIMFPSGLPVFWLVSNLIGIATQYWVGGGWGYLKRGTAPTAAAKAK